MEQIANAPRKSQRTAGPARNALAKLSRHVTELSPHVVTLPLWIALGVLCGGTVTTVLPRVARADEITSQSKALTDAIAQNTRAKNQAHPAGVPKTWNWYNGKSGTSFAAPAPTGFSAVTGWGIIYPEAEQPQPRLATDVIIGRFATYLHRIVGGWIEVQNQSGDSLVAGHFAADFLNNASSPLPVEKLTDDSVKIGGPGLGYNDHFWLSTRGEFEPGTVDGVFVTVKLKATQPDVNLIAAVGADWWRNSSAEFKAGFSNNPGIGQSNFIRLTANWQTLYYYSISTPQLEHDVPPLSDSAAN